MIEVYITISLLVSLVGLVLLLVVGSTESINITLFIVLVVGLLWPLLVIVMVAELFKDSA